MEWITYQTNKDDLGNFVYSSKRIDDMDMNEYGTLQVMPGLSHQENVYITLHCSIQVNALYTSLWGQDNGYKVHMYS